MYILNFENDTNENNLKDSEYFRICPQCKIIHLKSQKRKHLQSKLHLNTVNKLKMDCDELKKKYKSIKLILNAA